MIPSLAIFGAEAGNELSPFTRDIDTPDDLNNMINEIFKCPKRDLQDREPSTAPATADDEDDLDHNDLDVDDEETVPRQGSGLPD